LLGRPEKLTKDLRIAGAPLRSSNRTSSECKLKALPLEPTCLRNWDPKRGNEKYEYKGLSISPIEEKRRANIRIVDTTKLLNIYSEYASK
jgi:hypothetical protein